MSSKKTIAILMVVILFVSITVPAQAMTKKTLKVGQTWTLTIKGTKKKVKWKSSNTKVLKVKKVSGKKRQTCKFIAKKKGKSKVTIVYGKKKKVIVVTVKAGTPDNVEITEKKEDKTIQKEERGSFLTLSEYNITIDEAIEKTKTVLLKITTDDLANKGLQTKVSDSSICTHTKELISNKDGVCTYRITITAKKQGTVTMNFSCGDMKSQLTIQVVRSSGTTSEITPGQSGTQITTAEEQRNTTTQQEGIETPFLTLSKYQDDLAQYTGSYDGVIVATIPYSYVKQYATDSSKMMKALRSNTTVITGLTYDNGGAPDITGDIATYTIRYSVNTDVAKGYFQSAPYIEVSCGNLSKKLQINITEQATTQAITTTQQQVAQESYLKITKKVETAKVGSSDYILVEIRNTSAPMAQSNNSYVCSFGSSSLESYDKDNNTSVFRINLNFNKAGNCKVTIQNDSGYKEEIAINVVE